MTRLTKAHRQAQIVDAARKASHSGKLYAWTLRDIATAIGISRGTVAYHFSSAIALRRYLIADAVARYDYDIVSQAIVSHDPAVNNVGARTRAKAMRWLCEQ